MSVVKPKPKPKPEIKPKKKDKKKTKTTLITYQLDVMRKFALAQSFLCYLENYSKTKQ